jgi:transposase
MQIQYINEMLQIPEVQINQIQFVSDDEMHIEVAPVAKKQCCPICQSDQYVIRKGSNGLRKVRHLPAFENRVYLQIPSIRMHCTSCETGFVWSYEFVGPKKRYSHLFQEKIVEQAYGSTSEHSARIQQTPASTVQRMHNEAIPIESERLSEQAWRQAGKSRGLVLGVDDFAIKKGHTYNTGIHDLRGGTLLDILPGRKLDELREYAQQHPDFLQLTPKAVVMDLAQGYHTWISECFPEAIRIADRFHVHGYVIEALQEVRKSVQSTLAPRAKALLKANCRLLNPQAESLSMESTKRLHELLSYSSLLRSAWEWKESFTEWYDFSPDVAVATIGFKRWCEQGEQVAHEAVKSALKTMRNWQNEIINYHRCRWTNATVEGRHNRIKAFQRRHYFTRNRDRYKAGIIVECNRNRLLG